MNSFYDLPFFPIGPSDGVSGKDGVSPTVSIEEISGGHRLIIVDATGRKTVDIMNGKEGPQGPQGIQGLQGERGLTGERGPQGEKGDTGLQGIRGETGPKGDTGDQGPIGLTGPQGLQGETGPAGANGKSAYEYAQDNGYSGTEADFSVLLANAVSAQNISLGIHTDGLLHIFIDGEPIGTGISLTNTPEA